MPAIHPLSLEDREIIATYLQKYPPKISEITFTNLFGWRKTRPVYLTELTDTLVFFIDGDESGDSKIIFGPPAGNAPYDAILDMLSGSFSGTVRIPSPFAAACRKAGMIVEQDRNNADYVYRTKTLAELAGRKYAKKRNQIKQCLHTYRCDYETITPEIIQECINLQKRWCHAKECLKVPGLCGEYTAIMETLKHYTEFGLLGGAVRVNGRIEAFAIGEPLTPDTAVVHFEKAMPTIQGLSQLINQRFAQQALQQFEFINREQDLGIPGLRQAKESYYPHHLVMKYRASLPNSTHMYHRAQECRG